MHDVVRRPLCGRLDMAPNVGGGTSEALRRRPLPPSKVTWEQQCEPSECQKKGNMYLKRVIMASGAIHTPGVLVLVVALREAVSGNAS